MSHSGDNNVDLAALWVSVLPETSHLNEAMKKAGSEARRSFEEGMGGSDPGVLGSSFGEKFMQGFNAKFANADFGLGVSKMFEAINGQVDSKLASKLRGELPQAFRASRDALAEYDELERRNTRTKQELAEVTDRINLVQQNGLNVAHIMLPLMTQRNKLEKELAEGQASSAAAHEKASAAMEKHVDITNRFNEASASTFTATNLLAGAMGGLAVGGVQMVIGGFEKLIDLGAEVFEKATEGAVELADKLLEVGEDYHSLEVQAIEFSGATGEALENLTSHIDSVFSKLDVPGKQLGQTYAQLKQMLNLEPSPELDKLAQNVTDLQGRFSALKSQDIGAIFHVFKVPADQLNASLATMLRVSEDSGQGLSSITSALATAAPVLEEAHLSLGQSAKVIGDIEKNGIPANQVMTALQTSMKLFGKDNLDFGSGLRELLKELSDPGMSEGAKQNLAEAAFGTRRWGDALLIAKDLLGDISAAPDAFNAPAQHVDDFTQATETLGDKLEQLKHQVEAMLKPFGEGLLAGAEEGVKSLSDYLTQHKDQIINELVGLGHDLINFLPTLQHWTSKFGEAIGAALDTMAPFAEGVGEVVGAITALNDVMEGHFSDAWKDLHLGSDLKKDLQEASKKVDDLSQKFGDAHLPIDQWNRDLDDLATKAHAAADGLDRQADAQQRVNDNPLNPSPPGFLPPGGEYTPGPLSLAPGVPGLSPGAAHPSAYTNGQAGIAHAIYDAVVGAGYSPQTGIAAVAAAQHESSLDPNRWEAGGSNHFGLFQEDGDKPRDGAQQQIAWLISALNAAGGPAVVNADPAGVIAGRKVENGGYGGSALDLDAAAKLLGIGTAAHGAVATGGHGGIDDILIRVTAGERIMNLAASEKYGPLLDAMNAAPGFFTGGVAGGGDSGVLQVIWDDPRSNYKVGEAAGYGMVGPGTDQPQYYGNDWKDHHGHVHTSWASGPNGEFYGLPKGTDIRPGAGGFPDWVYQLGAQYGLQPSTYAGHQEGSGFNRGIDWWPAGVQDMSGMSYTPEQLSALDSFATNVASFGVGQSGGAGSVPADFYQGGDNYPEVSFASWHGPAGGGGGSHGGGGGGSRGGSSYVYGGGSDGSIGPDGTRGLPGQYGGYGTYGGETYDEYMQHQRDVRHANDRVNELIKERDKLQNVDIPKLQGELNTEQNKPDLLKDQAKIDRLKEQLDTLQARLDKITSESLPEANEDVDTAQRHSDEAANKAPRKEREGGLQQRDESYNVAKQFGSGFLSGIAQELGFPDLLGGKPPWDFGAVKLLTHGLGTLLSWGSQIGKMDQVMGQGGDDGMATPFGLASGMGGGLGLPNIKLPSLTPKQGGNQQFPPISSGQGNGPLPGPGAGPISATPQPHDTTHSAPDGGGQGKFPTAMPLVYRGGDTYHIQSSGDQAIAHDLQQYNQSWNKVQAMSPSIPHPAG